MTLSRKTLGILGSIVLLAGLFAPVARLSILGSVSLFGAGNTDGIVLLVLAVVSLLLALVERYRWLYLTGGLALLVIVVDFFTLMDRLSTAKGKASSAGAVGKALGSSVSLEWGWVLLFAGVGLILACAYGPRRRVPREHERLMDIDEEGTHAHHHDRPAASGGVLPGRTGGRRSFRRRRSD